MCNNTRHIVKTLYKNAAALVFCRTEEFLALIFLGRDYPKGEKYFRDRCHAAFMRNKEVTDPKKLQELLARGEYVIKELEALYMLRKYRALKKRYYHDL